MMGMAIAGTVLALFLFVGSATEKPDSYGSTVGEGEVAKTGMAFAMNLRGTWTIYKRDGRYHWVTLFADAREASGTFNTLELAEANLRDKAKGWGWNLSGL